MRVGNCPLENKIADALTYAGIEFFTDFEGRVSEHLDFYLPKFDLFLEVKGGHSDRISSQMKRASNIIAVQGMKSVDFLVKLLTLK